jgi:hypothetical protein
MRACRTVVATALLGMAAGMCFDADGASLGVGITIVETCQVETHGSGNGAPMDTVRSGCRTDTPYSVALDGRPLRDDGRSPPAAVPDDGISAISADPGRRIATFTF